MNRHPEHDIHVAVAQYLSAALRDPRTWWTSVDHAHAYNRLTGAMRKARGVKPGIPDILVLHDGILIGIELKSAIGRASPAQLAVADAIACAGGAWHLCRSVADVEAALAMHNVPLSARTLGLQAVA